MQATGTGQATAFAAGEALVLIGDVRLWDVFVKHAMACLFHLKAPSCLGSGFWPWLPSHTCHGCHGCHVPLNTLGMQAIYTMDDTPLELMEEVAVLFEQLATESSKIKVLI